MALDSPSIAPAVRLPVALAPDGSLRWARDRPRHEACTCVGCGAPVVLRAGSERQAHFAHSSRAPCSAETALHRATITLLAEQIERASRERQVLAAPQPCEDCDRVAIRNLARLPDLRALREHTVSSRGRTARPDLVFIHGARRAYALEVVVTHAPEDAARAVMAELALPIVVVRPSWEAIAALSLPLASIAALGEARIEGAPCDGWRHPPARAPSCPSCGRQGARCTVQQWRGAKCWRCGGAVPFVDVRVHDESAALDCDGWDGQPIVHAATIGASLIPLAIALGASLAERWTYRTNRVTPEHACISCGATQSGPARGADAEPQAVLAASWCRRCRTIAPTGPPRSRPSAARCIAFNPRRRGRCPRGRTRD